MTFFPKKCSSGNETPRIVNKINHEGRNANNEEKSHSGYDFVVSIFIGYFVSLPPGLFQGFN